jgi:ribose-phosphate pyrophosphokinase
MSDINIDSTQSANVLVFAAETPESKSLGNNICSHLGVELSPCEIARFADRESQPRFGESVSNKICVIVIALHDTSSISTNDSSFVLFQMCNALHTSQAKEIIICSPYTPYARQDKPDDKRSCVTSGLFATLLRSACGSTPVRYITFDLHAGQLVTVFNAVGVRCDNIHSEPHMASFITEFLMKKLNATPDDIVLVSPDAGANKKAKRIAKQDIGVGCGYAIMDKTRKKASIVESTQLIGEVDGMNAIISDDMCDTGGTICRAAATLKEKGAITVTVMFCHGVFSKNAMDLLQESEHIDLVVCTNTIDRMYEVTNTTVVGEHSNITFSQLKSHPKILMIDISWLAAEAVRRRVGKESVSYLYDSRCTSASHMEFLMQKAENEEKSSNKPVSPHKISLLEKTYRKFNTSNN